MTESNLAGLMHKLTLPCLSALTKSVEYGVSKHHNAIEPEHFLLELIKEPNTGMLQLFKHCNLSKETICDHLVWRLGQLSCNNKAIPILSAKLISWINIAETIAKQHHRSVISAFDLLFVFTLTKEWKSLAIQLSSAFSSLSAESILNDAKNKANHEQTEKLLTASLPESTESAKSLDNYTYNLTIQMKQGKSDPIDGRDREITQIIDILLRRRQNNPILVGEAGVGKTAIIEGLAQYLLSEKAPKSIMNTHIHVLDLASLQAGASIKGEFEQRLKTLIETIQLSETRIILFIDEAHCLIGAGGQAGLCDAANLLKPALARGELQIIAATTWDEYKRYIEKDAALTRRLQIVKVDEPNEAVTISMLEKISLQLTQYHKVKVSREAIEAAVRLSIKYLPERRLPDKAISLLDTACAQLRRLHPDKSDITVDAETIAKIIAQWTGIPVGNINQNEKNLLMSLYNKLRARIIGQDYALKRITEHIQAARLQIHDPKKPAGVFLLVGSSGIGKTETALALAELLYGDENAITVINMSEFKEPHKVSLLTGAPAGYVGYGEGGKLTEAVRRKPYQVVLLDEIEKAHPSVQEFFYQLFDKGLLMDSEGHKVDFRHTVILMTANVAEDVIQNHAKLNEFVESPSFQKALQHVLLSRFSPAFLGRLTILPYVSLDRQTLMRILQQQLSALEVRLKEHYHAIFTYSQKFFQHLFNQCETEHMGARKIQQTIQKLLLPLMTKLFLQALDNNQAITHLHLMLNKQLHYEARIKTKKKNASVRTKKIINQNLWCTTVTEGQHAINYPIS